MRVLVTGGAGFVGANVAIGLAARHSDWELVAFDNLRRRGSELNLRRLRDAGVSFVHGDVRMQSDLAELEDADAIIECSAEPSVMAGVGGSPDYVVQANLIGAYNCLELARRTGAHFVFLSTSRVYPMGLLRQLKLEETAERYELRQRQILPGVTAAGISESFPVIGARTMYGATKLAVELLIEEYRTAYGLSAVVSRCGVIAGPWQMGKVDQGVFTHWMLAHYFGWPLSYIGFGGSGKQVRDLLHVEDLVDLVDEQVRTPENWDGAVVNVGGGRDISLSLKEASLLCTEITGRAVALAVVAETRPGDVPLYLSDCSALFARTSWRPRRSAREVLADTCQWIRSNEAAVKAALEPPS